MPCEPASTIHLHRVLSRIRELGKKAGAVLNPASPIALVEHVLHLCDVVLVMTVNPGFGGQAFIPETMEKVAAAARLRQENGWRFHIEVDGGIKAETVKIARECGANVMVAGTSVFGASDAAAAICGLRDA